MFDDELGVKRLLALGRRLVAQVNASDILACACQEAAHWAGADAAFGSYKLPGRPWQRGVHVLVRGEVQPVSHAARSAMFALHRRLVAARRPLLLEEDESTGAIYKGLCPGSGPVRAVFALPVLQGRGSVMADIILVSERADHFLNMATEPLEELTKLTATALQNAQRLASARRDQERLQLLAEATEEALWDWDLENEELWWGGGILNMLGSSTAVSQRRMSRKFEGVHPNDEARVRASFEAALRSNQSAWREEYQLVRADGARVMVEDRAYFLRDADGRAYRVIGALRDLSPLKQLLSREQQARAEAETASRAKDEFLAMLGHELRNPLAPIVTALHVMKRKGDGSTERERTVIERQAQHLVRLVDDLLDVSRIARGMIELERKEVELALVVEKGLEIASPLLALQRHCVDVDVPAEGLRVHGDAGRLAQVVSNLLTNAAKYTPPPGQITVRGSREGDEVVLKVSDTGIGISAEMLPRVFDMFSQERQPSDRSRGGLGLGLSIVRNLVMLHGGHVEAASGGLGEGSEFTVRLPAFASAPAVELSQAAPLAAHDAAHGRCILVVDDNRDAAELLATYLEALGHTTRYAFDGPSALRLIETFEPDLALLDIGLPQMDGYELARRLRARITRPDLRLIAVTGYGQPGDKCKAQEAGFDAHLVKPLIMEQLQQVMEKLWD